MKTHESNIQCPSCHGPLVPRILTCDSCDIKVEGRFQMNEFATLSPEDLHFLRIFVHSEGRVREMESALGLSYPTIRSRLTALKNKLVAPANVPPQEKSATAKVLERLEKGEISFEEAMSLIKK